MIEFGATLKSAREAKGLTVEQVADMTRIMPSMVEDLEAENFSRIAAPLYGRGFVKLYCNAVGIAPEPLIAEFMEIYNGNRDLGIKERPTATRPLPEPPATENPIREPAEPAEPVEAMEAVGSERVEAPAAEESLFQSAATDYDDGIKEAVIEEEPPAKAPDEIIRPSGSREPDLFSIQDEQPAPGYRQETAEDSMANFSRYAAPVRQNEDEIRPPVMRWLILAACAVAVAALVFFGLRTLYRATSAPRVEPGSAEADVIPSQAAEEKAAENAAAQAKPETAAASDSRTKGAAPRDPQKIPPLYID